ncbi:homogentisate 1,2-dioxygenase [Diaporthe sp. PMI_573]|nr:homogentisate 1,2-dioxygenase [Diaporthaceae sp. PMI_573]
MPVTEFALKEKYRYQNGFDSYFETEAVPDALPVGQNSPQKPPHGLYAEKLSGTAFTAPRHENKQTWLYRILPSCSHPPFEPASSQPANGHGNGQPVDFKESAATKMHYIPNQLRWDPFDQGSGDTDFVSGLHLVAGAGDPTVKSGLGIYIFAAAKSMDTKHAFYSADGDFLLVAQEGVLDIRTEQGWLLVRPMEIAVIPRGVKFAVYLPSGPARGYALELYQGHFVLPELGPIGSNGLANARDFQAPLASFDEDCGSVAFDGPNKYTVTAKFANSLYQTVQPHTPFDVVAWHGNYYPYKYDLGRFNTIGSISFDHPDPSIFTVLSAPSDHIGTAIADFVIFPPRWLVGEDTFRPPWYHRNTMSEFMGLIQGGYDAKKGGAGGFVPGGASLHNVMSGHGPDADSYDGARNAELKPAKVGAGSCAFMFESCLMVGVTDWGLKTCSKVQEEYNQHSWGGVKVHWKRPAGAKADGHLLK